MEILSSLHGSAVSRLRASWTEVSPKVKETFDELSATMSNIGNFKNYRDLYAALDDNDPCIPFIRTDLTFFTTFWIS